MKKEIIKKINKAKNCFALVMINEDDGEYLLVSKKTVKHLLDTCNDIDQNKFVLRESGDLYIN